MSLNLTVSSCVLMAEDGDGGGGWGGLQHLLDIGGYSGHLGYRQKFRISCSFTVTADYLGVVNKDIFEVVYRTSTVYTGIII
jgi:hypothetical protein